MWHIRHVVELQDEVCAMTEPGERDVKVVGAHPLIIAAAFATGANTNKVYRAVTNIVVVVSLKILGANFQLQGIYHFWMPPSTSEPLSRPSRPSRSSSRRGLIE